MTNALPYPAQRGREGFFLPMKKILILFPFFLLAAPSFAALQFWLLGSLAAHLAAVVLIQFEADTNQPTGKTISVQLDKSASLSSRGVQTPPGWADPSTPPQEATVTITSFWRNPDGSVSAETPQSVCDIIAAPYSGTITQRWGSSPNQTATCNVTGTTETGVAVDSNINVYEENPTTTCPTGYQYDGTTCQLVDPNLVPWPTYDNVKVIDATDQGMYVCNSRDPDCDNIYQGFTVSGNTVSAVSSTQVITVQNNGSGQGSTITVQDNDGNGNNTSWTQHRYDDNGNLTSTQTGIGTAPYVGQGNGQTTSAGDCGGPNQVPCDVHLSTTGMPSNFTSNEFDSSLDQVYQQATDGLSQVNVDHAPSENDWLSFLALPTGTCGDLSLTFPTSLGITKNINFDFTTLQTKARDILAWIFYFLTLLKILDIVFSAKPK